LRVLLLYRKGSKGIKRFCYELVCHLNKYRNVNATAIALESFKISAAFINFLKQHDYIVHVNYAILARLMNKGVKNLVYTCHGIPQPVLENNLFDKIAYTLETQALRRISKEKCKVVSISDYVSSALIRDYGIYSTTIYNGVNHTHFYPLDKNEKRNLKEKMSLKDKKVILNVGRLNLYKNQITLLKAIKSLPNDISEKAVLIIVGEGPLEEILQKEAEHIKHHKRIKVMFLKNISEEALRTFYQVADVYIHTSINEMFGLSLLEAMASGLPVISSNGGAAKEILGTEYDLFFDPFDADKLAFLMEKILSSETDREAYASFCHKRSLFFSWEKTANAYLKVYGEVV